MTVIHQSWLKQPHLVAIFDALGDDNVRFVGGCVRDALLKRDIHDIDMATTLTPDKVIEKLEAHGIKTIPTGIQHGTVTAVSGGKPIEITTLRSDTACDGRHAEVVFTQSWEEDAKRRDFSINALSCDRQGQVYDYNYGLKDIKVCHLYFIGNAVKRCREDYLRILRYFRFFATLSVMAPDENSVVACMVEKEGIKTLSGERIQHEMKRLLAAPSVLKTLKLMEVTEILEEVLLRPANVDVLIYFDAIEHGTNHPKDPMVRLAVICHANQFTREEVMAIVERWKLSNNDKDRLLAVCFPPCTLPAEMDFDVHQPVIRALGRDIYLALLLMQWAGEEAGQYDKEYLAFYEMVMQWKVPTFPLSGKMLIASGFKAGKSLGEQLKKAEQYWEVNRYEPDAESLVAWLKQSSG